MLELLYSMILGPFNGTLPAAQHVVWWMRQKDDNECWIK